jgi:2'-5' RNA ligase
VTVPRLFVAVDPSPEVRASLDRAASRVRALAPRARWVDPSLYHLTLAFLGEQPEAQIPALSAAVATVAARGAPFELRFCGAGAFGGGRPRVLWAGVGGAVDAFLALERELCGALAPFGYAPDHPASPHLTLARGDGRGGDPALSDCAQTLAGEDFGVARVAALVLYESTLGPRGASYAARATLPLGA